MKKRSLAIAAGAVLASFATLMGSAASGVAASTPGSVTTTEQLTSTNGVVPVKGDFDGDNRDDIFWYVQGSGIDELWSGKVQDSTNATTTADRFDVTTLNITGAYTPIVGDFNGDGRDDILWYSPGPGADSIWYFTGRGTVFSKDLAISGLYQTAVGDFDATDGLNADDILWYNNSSSFLWTSQANETFSSASILNPPDNAKVYVGNFRQTALTVGAKEYLDVLFYVAGTGADAIWAGNGDGGFTSVPVTINGNYNPIIGNFDANTNGVDTTDIFWYAPGTAADSVWMNAGTSFTNRAATVNGRYQPLVIPSKESTSQDDIFWDSKTAGDFLWATNGTNTAFSYTSMTPSAWGGSDIGYRNGIAGDFNIATPSSGAASTSLAGSGFNKCALTSSSGVACWGYGGYGGMGVGNTSASLIPVTPTGLDSGVSQIATGLGNNCALLTTGSVKCWGQNSSGQAGTGSKTPNLILSPATATALNGLSIAEMALGETHSCFRLTDGTVRCLGANASGQLGNGTTTESLTPVTATGLTGVTQLDSGTYSTCALLTGGTVKCWGSNINGMLGDGTTTPRSTPVTVAGISGATEIAVGDGHVCALLSDGTVKCWGSNGYGQLGNGTTTNSTTPVTVSSLSGVTDIASSFTNTCATLASGTVRCWGMGIGGELGNGSTVSSSTPVTVVGLTGTPATLAVGVTGGCVLTTTGKVQCWGSNSYGERGTGSTGGVTTATEVAGGYTFGNFTRPTGNADVLWWYAGNGTGETEVMWYDLDSLS